jgi:hypothetical protein
LKDDDNGGSDDGKAVDFPSRKRKATKKGIIITAIIVTAIIGASFIVYFIP